MTGHLLFAAGTWQPLLTLILKALTVMGSPGPSTMAVTVAGAVFGVRRSLGFVSGAIAGTLVVLLSVATGLVVLLTSIPGLGLVLMIGSAAYILWLAWIIATAPPLAQQNAAIAPSAAAGFLLAIANPKAWLAIAAVFAGSVLVVSSWRFDAVIKAVVLAAMIVVIHLLWLLCGVSLAGFLSDPLRSRIANILFGLILVGATVLALIR
jgi:threonine/homoserine/homoserine lactone efflux protein